MVAVTTSPGDVANGIAEQVFISVHRLVHAVTAYQLTYERHELLVAGLLDDLNKPDHQHPGIGRRQQQRRLIHRPRRRVGSRRAALR
ncbi:hypothetical protein [Herbidospora mongoliensis]|uniref:hypothetical protein n=1 Tax=Herbidospora mongoliensis TaxID=688067 RepID=UPI0008325049|nr:hypothetical protein [Herbidospora mongoliensis]